MNSENTRLLLLAANPLDTTPLQLDEEVRAIDAALRMSRLRDQIELVSHWAVRVEDVVELLLRHQPALIHFSGHGSPNNRIALQGPAGRSDEIDGDAFVALVQLAGKTARGVFLNACYSELQGKLLAESIPAVIAVAGEIVDEAAIAFASAFYHALGYGESIEAAFRLALAELQATWPDQVQNVHLFGIAAALRFQVKAAEPPADARTHIQDSTIKGMVQTNYGNVSMTFNEGTE